MRVTVLEHLPHEGPGLLAEVAAARGLDATTVALWAGTPCPSAPPEALVVLGGDMCTDEKEAYPHLADEVALLAACVEAGTPVLGICLGAQLLAEATGGAVAHGEPEIGYPPIQLTAAGRADRVLQRLRDGAPAFNGHRDHITLGPQATRLAYSEAAAVHAFRVGSAYGVQFHPEFTADMVAGYVSAPGVPAYLRAAGWEPAQLLAAARRHEAAHRRDHAALLHAWFDWATGR